MPPTSPPNPTDPTTALPWTPADALAGLSRSGDKPAVVRIVAGTAETTSGTELRRRVLGAAAALVAAGIGRGTVVAIWAPNGPGWIAAALACHHLGAILAPLDSLLAAPEAVDQAEASGAALLLVEGDPPAAAAGRVPTRDLASLPAADDGPPAADLGPDDPIALFRTSGTTGTPKAFHLSLMNIGWNVRAMTDSGHVTAGDRVLMPLPMHHVFPWITATLSSVTNSATLIFPEGLTGPQIAEALRMGRPTIVIGVPRLFDALLAGIRARLAGAGRLAASAFDGLLGLSARLQPTPFRRLGTALLAPLRRRVAPDLRLLVSGGALLSVETQTGLTALGWDVRSGYGLAETASSIAANLRVNHSGSAGTMIEGCAARIENPDADGIGEILVHGPVVFAGYIDNPAANAEAFAPDGFFRTGDLGRIDKDGILWVTGRMKEVIKLAGGDKLYPEDIERRYLASPLLAEIGVMERDGALVALIVPALAEVQKTGASSAEDAVRVALGLIAKTLPQTWRLTGFALTREPLPRTRLGKLRRFRLPELYDRARAGGGGAAAREPTPEERAWIATPPRDAVWAILGRETKGTAFDLDSHLQLDLGVDSFGWMTLGLAIEEATGVRLGPVDMAEIATVRDLLTRVSEIAADPARHGPDTAEILARDRARWRAPLTGSERVTGRLLYGVNTLITHGYFRLRARGTGTLPAGPFLLCPNHVSDLDALMVAGALPAAVRERLAWAAARSRVFGNPVFPRLARTVQVFPVDDRVPTVAVDLAVETLGAGGAQVWFPEGWRSPDGTLLPFQPGVGHVILRSGAPVVPVLISGTLEALPRDRRLPRPAKVTVTFGAPIPAATLRSESAAGPDDAAGIAEALHARYLRFAAEATAAGPHG
jgi:long-chain acyl-CoA synthetase